jgi:hypothetical protein
VTSLQLMAVLLVAFQFKHFLADYPFQTEFMLGKFKDTGWFEPLAAHCAVHAFGTATIAYFVGAPGPLMYLLPLLDFVVHFLMDRQKASPYRWGRFKALTGDAFLKVKADAATGSYYERNAALVALRDNKLFWWSLGFDQMVHHLTHYAIIGLLVQSVS